ncbi:MAG TPA: SsrA-binding protein, partial [Chloroflexota bacterium]|nr:SsrA-binding protein [Chloroflexota bacterium]
KRGRAKIELGLAKGKHLWDKRDDLAQRDAKRDIEQALAN